MGKHLTKDQIQDICNRYLGGEKIPAIAKSINRRRDVIHGAIKRNGVPIRPQTIAQRKYTCNDNFFSELNEQSAYWAGFIAADGYILDRGGSKRRLVIRLSIKDIAHLYKFRDTIRSNHPISKEKRKMCRIYICSKQITDDLEVLSITKRKTFSVSWPNLSDELLRHYLRGYFDGDGSVYCRFDHHTPNLTFSITSNIIMLEGMQNYLIRQCDLEKTKIYIKKNRDPRTGQMRYMGRTQLRKIYHLMYKDSTVWLSRKKEIFDKYLFTPIPSRKKFSPEQRSKICGLYCQGTRATQLTKICSTSLRMIYEILQEGKVTNTHRQSRWRPPVSIEN